MIAGEGLVGILLAIFAVLNIADKIDFSSYLNTSLVGGIVLMIIMILCVWKAAVGKSENK